MDYFMQGLRAWVNGAFSTDNPYKEGSTQAIEWENGYFSHGVI